MAITIQEVWWFLVAILVFMMGNVKEKRLGPIIAIMAFFVVDDLGPPESGMAIMILMGLLIYSVVLAMQEDLERL